MTGKILHLLASNPKHSWSPRELSRFLKISPDKRRESSRILEDLARAGKILRHRGGKYSAPKKEPVVEGAIKIHRDGYGFVLSDIPGEPDVFIPPRFIYGALPDDRVRAAFVENPETGRREGKVVSVVSRGRSHWAGRLIKQEKKFWVVNQNEGVDLLVHVPAGGLSSAKEGELVEVEVTRYAEGGGEMEGKILRVLGEPYSLKAEAAAILVRHDIPESFPSNVIAESETLPEVSSADFTGRVDLTHLPFLTIDGEKARDFDDAVYWESRNSGTEDIYVAIADVAHYVKPGSIIDREALARGTSVYFPDFVVPMLPERLSNDLCSLKPDVPRLTLVAQIRFDPGGNPLEASYYEAVIRSVKRGIYEEVQAFYDGEEGRGFSHSAPLQRSLLGMKNLAERMIAQREKRGSLDFDLPDTEVLLSEAGETISIQKVLRVFSHRLIEEFMIGANVAVGSLFSFLKMPLLYRVHDRPDTAKIGDFIQFVSKLGRKGPVSQVSSPRDLKRILDGFKDHPLETFLHQLLLRSLKWALYSPINKGHYGLNLKCYCHFTSPIRRYPDLTVHRQLKTLLQKAPDRKITFVFEQGKKRRPNAIPQGRIKGLSSTEELDTVGKLSSQKEREAMEAERDMLKLRRLKFMQDRLGERFSGVIRRLTKFGIFLELFPFDIEGLLLLSALKDDYYTFDEKNLKLVGRKKHGKVYRLGDTVPVVVDDVSWEKREICLRPA